MSKTKQLRSIEWRLRRIESALRWRKEKFRIYPNDRFLRNFPSLRGRKFWMEKWVDDYRIKVHVSGNKNPSYYAATFFKGFGK